MKQLKKLCLILGKASFDLIGNDKLKKACTSASIITFTYDENDNAQKDTFVVYIAYPSHYKEVVMVQTVDLQTAIGAAGGYIGLFVGKIIWISFKLIIIYLNIK